MVTLVNKFTVHGDPQEFERVWKESSEFMRRQPGFVNFHLVRSLSDPSVYINIAKWADAKSHQQVMAGQEFRSHIGALAALAKPEPYLCHTVIEHDAA